jgi:hypothetical protein
MQNLRVRFFEENYVIDADIHITGQSRIGDKALDGFELTPAAAAELRTNGTLKSGDLILTLDDNDPTQQEISWRGR